MWIHAAAPETEYFLFVDDDSVLHERYVEIAVGVPGDSAKDVALTGGLLALPYNAVRSVGVQGAWRRTRVRGNLHALGDLMRRRIDPGRVVELDR